MTAQPQENRYEVRIWFAGYDEHEGWYYTSYFLNPEIASAFVSVEQANAWAEKRLTQKDQEGNPIGIIVLDNGIVTACHGIDVDCESARGRVVGWMIATFIEDRTGQYDAEDYEEHTASTPQEWEQIERQTRRQNRRLYVKVQSMGKVEHFGGRPGKRHKWTPDFFPLGMKLVQKACDFCQESFWFPHGRSAGHGGYTACEKHCHLL